MKTFTKTINRLEDKNNFLIDIVIKLWFTERYNQVLDSNDEDKKELYSKVNIEKAYKLFNTGYFRSDNYIRSTIISREAGVCFPDPKFNFLPFEKFLTEYLDPDKRLYLTGQVPAELNIDNLKALAQSNTSYPLTPKTYLTKLNNKYALLYFCNFDTHLNSDYINHILFKRYNLNQVEIAIQQSGDSQYPNEINNDIENLKIGTISIMDKCLEELNVVINVYNIKLISELLNKVTDLNYDGAAKFDGTHTYSGVY